MLNTEEYQPTPNHAAPDLPDSLAEWPVDAIEAYRSLMADLNRWSRDHGCGAGNASIAETAIRQAWA